METNLALSINLARQLLEDKKMEFQKLLDIIKDNEDLDDKLVIILAEICDQISLKIIPDFEKVI